MTAVFEPVRQARRMWELTAPQLTLSLDGADAAPLADYPSGANTDQSSGQGRAHTGDADRSPETSNLPVPTVPPGGSRSPSTASTAPAVHFHDNAGSAQSHSGTRALPAERSIDQ